MTASDLLSFARAFLRSPLRTGAIAPSSRALATLIVGQANLGRASSIAELGCGTGVVTRAILEAKKPTSSLLVLEINPALAKHAQGMYPEADIRLDSAAHLPRYVHERHGEKFDAIISGLPWAACRHAHRKVLLKAIASSLAPRGTFVTFAYLQGLLLPSGHHFRRELGAHFKSVQATHVAWKNVPPAFVYVATL